MMHNVSLFTRPSKLVSVLKNCLKQTGVQLSIYLVYILSCSMKVMFKKARIGCWVCVDHKTRKSGVKQPLAMIRYR